MMEDLIHLQQVELGLDGGCGSVRIAALAVPPGQTVAVLGGDAATRQVLLQVLAALAQPAAGQVCVAGQPLDGLRGNAAADWRNAHIGWVSAQPTFLERLPVLENAALPLCICGVARPLREKAAMEALHRVGLRPVAYALPGKLTRQERLRLGLAQALAAQPQVLLLDELAAVVSAAEMPRWQDILAGYPGDQRAVLEFSQDNTLLAADRTWRIIQGEMTEDPR